MALAPEQVKPDQQDRTEERFCPSVHEAKVILVAPLVGLRLRLRLRRHNTWHRAAPNVRALILWML